MAEPPSVLVTTATLEGVMSLSTEHQTRNLPKRLPAGTVYVVEGRGGQHGNLRVSSRYVLMPSGQKVEMPAELGRTERARIALRRSFAPKGGQFPVQTEIPSRPKNLHSLLEQGPGSNVDWQAPGEAPQPLTLNHPASNPGRI
jgi:hypothetical protein